MVNTCGNSSKNGFVEKNFCAHTEISTRNCAPTHPSKPLSFGSVYCGYPCESVFRIRNPVYGSGCKPLSFVENECPVQTDKRSFPKEQNTVREARVMRG
jgi:hypothetical protein